MNTWLLGGILSLSVSISSPEVSELSLDFTFPTAQVIENVGTVNAIAVNPDGEVVMLVDDRSQMLFVSLAGELLERMPLRVRSKIVGAEWPTDDEVFLLTHRGKVLNVDLSTRRLTHYSRLPRRLNFQSIAASADGTLYGINNRATRALFTKAPGKKLTHRRLDRRLRRYRITGLHAFGDSLYATAHKKRGRSRSAFVLKLSTRGKLLGVWSIAGNPRGLSVRGELDRGPELLTINRDKDVSIMLYEPEPDPSEIDQPVLPLLNAFALGDASISQPSGAAYRSTDASLYFATDFGVIARSNAAGGDVEALFEIPDAVQGTYEAIGVEESGDLTVLASDDSVGGTSLYTYDLFGNLISRQDITLDETVVEAFAIEPATQDRWWVAQPAGQPTSLMTVSPAGDRNSLPLPEDYSDLTFTGLEVADNRAFMVTDEREVDDRRLAGLLIVWDIDNGAEIGRFSIGVPDMNGSMVGMRAPSGVAVDLVGRRIYVTSDTDDGDVICYDLRGLVERLDAAE